MVWFTSDLHLGHEAIIRMQNRPFRNVEEMDNALIHHLNECVRPNDKLYILGDISHHLTPEESNALIKRIHGKKYLILGNHDVTGDPEACRYDTGLFEWVDFYRKINVNGLTLVLMHYPMMTWPKARAGSVMLHGHIHAGPGYNSANKEAEIRRFDVGVDANNYYPVSVDQIRRWAGEIILNITSKAEELRTLLDYEAAASYELAIRQNRKAYDELGHKLTQNTGEMLRYRRMMLNHTQRQAADQAEISLRQYQRFESGESDIFNAPLYIACRVIEALGMDISDFYHGIIPESGSYDKG